MFDTWASYESTRAFVTSSFLLATLGPARRARGSAWLHFAAVTIGQAPGTRRVLARIRRLRLPHQQVRLLAGLRSAVRVCQLSSRRPLRRHRFPRLHKRPDQGCFGQRDYLRPEVFPPSLGIVRSMLGSLGFVRPAFRHRRPHRRPHVLPRRACLSRFLQDSPEGGEGGLAANARDPAQTPQGDAILEKVILAKRCHYPQPRQPQTHPPTKATEGSHCASSRRASS